MQSYNVSKLVVSYKMLLTLHKNRRFQVIQKSQQIKELHQVTGCNTRKQVDKQLKMKTSFG